MAAPSVTVCFYRLVQYQSSGFQSTSHVDIFQNLSKYCVLNLCLSLFNNGFCPEVCCVSWIKPLCLHDDCYFRLL